MEVKLYKVCRACMVNANESMNISEFMKMTDKIVEMFTFCTSIEVKIKILYLNILKRFTEIL